MNHTEKSDSAGKDQWESFQMKDDINKIIMNYLVTGMRCTISRKEKFHFSRQKIK